MVLRLEEESYAVAEKPAGPEGRPSTDRARRFTVTAVGTNLSSLAQDGQMAGYAEDVGVVDFANQLATVTEASTSAQPSNRSSKVGRMPPPIPPAGSRPLSWQTSSDSSASHFEEYKKLQFPIPPSYRRPSSWRRMTSGISSDSNVSPFDQRKKQLEFPLPSPESDVTEPFPAMEATSLGRTSPSLIRSIPSNLMRRLSSAERFQVRRPSGAPSPGPPSPRSSRTLTDRILRRPPSQDSELTWHIPTPTIEFPAPAVTNYPRQQRGYIHALDGGRDWPLNTSNPDTGHYVTALANTGSRSRDWLYIKEEDEPEEEAVGNNQSVMRNAQENQPRPSMQSGRSSRKSRVFISDDEDF